MKIYLFIMGNVGSSFFNLIFFSFFSLTHTEDWMSGCQRCCSIDWLQCSFVLKKKKKKKELKDLYCPQA